MIHKQQIGFPRQDIIMGLCMTLARNFISNVCRGKELKPPFLFQGGVSANPGIRRALEIALDHEVIIPKYHMVMGAYGAAILALEAGIAETRFRGYAAAFHPIHSEGFICRDCPNHCEIVEIRNNEEVLGRSGSRCGKWNSRQI
jgi:hypothetical protein